jgi:hypothetical protein
MDEGRAYVTDDGHCGTSHRVAGWHTVKGGPKIWGGEGGFEMFSDIAIPADKLKK